MAKWSYRKDRRQLVVHDTLAVYQLNVAASLILELLIQGSTPEQVAVKLAHQLGMPLSAMRSDVDTLLERFAELDIDGLFSVGTSDKVWQPLVAIVHIIQSCNSPCVMCDCWKTRDKTWHSAKDLRPFFQLIKDRGATEIMLSGGEATLHPELRQIISDLEDIGLKCRLNTNGLTLHKLSWLRDSNLYMLVVSMDSCNAETYRILRGVDGFSRVTASLKEFKQASPQTQVTVRATFNRHLILNLDQLRQYAIDTNLDRVTFSPADVDSPSFGRGTMSQARVNDIASALLPSSPTLEQFLRTFVPGDAYFEIVKAAWVSGLFQWGPREFIRCANFYSDWWVGRTGFVRDPCLFPKHSMVVDYDGSLRSCFYSKPFGDLLTLDKADWSLTNRILEIEKSGICSRCRGKVFCDVDDGVTVNYAK